MIQVLVVLDNPDKVQREGYFEIDLFYTKGLFDVLYSCFFPRIICYDLSFCFLHGKGQPESFFQSFGINTAHDALRDKDIFIKLDIGTVVVRGKTEKNFVLWHTCFYEEILQRLSQ
ncbi:hypothetical protein BMS3Abin09_00683 [bacterium BMS3Abin09]|nr:hypothetical protein BMS3Abin09_00683 [bacterium BMS3Abin09]